MPYLKAVYKYVYYGFYLGLDVRSHWAIFEFILLYGALCAVHYTPVWVSVMWIRIAMH